MYIAYVIYKVIFIKATFACALNELYIEVTNKAVTKSSPVYFIFFHKFLCFEIMMSFGYHKQATGVLLGTVG